MAAYAALVSLINNIEQIKNHPRVSTMFDETQLESLLQRVDSLLVFINSYNNSYGGSKDEAEDLERLIASAAHSAEDVIESHIVDQILPEDMVQSLIADQTVVGSDEALIPSIIRNLKSDNTTEDIIHSPIADQIVARSNIQLEMLDLWKIIRNMDSIREKVLKVEEERGCKVELPPESPMPAASSRPPAAGKSKMVGFDGYFSQLLDKLTGHQPDRQIIPIIGMGGLGKTTLARNAYDSLPVTQHFVIRAWVVISQTYIARDILFQILSSLGESMHGKEEHELWQLLYKTLFNRRYLIILDDMWSIEAWDKMKFFFPNNCNGSRILVTTRISDVANHFGSMGLELKSLDVTHSWKLFCEKVFPEEVFPPELEESGKKIVERCRGLPLAIVVIGGLLGSISRRQDQWKNVEKDITSILNTANDNQCLKLLSLSYSHLPARLKPCFLYLGIFPEDNVIRVSRLIKLWVSEGFIKPNKNQSLEEIAEGCIKDLVDRNLISVDTFRWNGKVKTICVHDLVRDLCIRVAEKEEFLCITTSGLDIPQQMDRQRRVIIHGSTGYEKYYDTRVLGTLKSSSLPRSLIFGQGRQVHVKFRLLRVLAGVYTEPKSTIFQQVNLRLLAQEHSVWSSEGIYAYQLPSSISLLWNLQTLIMTGGTVYKVYAPSEIWEMPQLRHLMLNFIILPCPPPGDSIILANLQTLWRVVNFSFTEEACKRMPNIKKLYVYYDSFSRNGCNAALFNRLESLHYVFGNRPGRGDLLLSFKFPNSLKKLTLELFRLQWKDLTVIASLPHLEALILMNATTGPNWDLFEAGVGFLRLRYLRIVESGLICWDADDTHFPALENLVLVSLMSLKEIPSGFGDIQTLERISLANCSDSCALSAVKILEEQHNFGNKGLQVKLRFAGKWRVEEFMKLVEKEGLTDLNFQIGADWRN